ncbi:MAG TPA: hypothetical protein VKI61_10540 [Chitinophagaceae bacterium]|nr:hypothetical protein [Chitinophagaceae bacterium]
MKYLIAIILFFIPYCRHANNNNNKTGYSFYCWKTSFYEDGNATTFINKEVISISSFPNSM